MWISSKLLKIVKKVVKQSKKISPEIKEKGFGTNLENLKWSQK